MNDTTSNPIRDFARAGAAAANSLLEKMPEKVQKKATHLVKNGYRLCLSMEVGSGDPVIRIELVNDLEQRHSLIECRPPERNEPQRH